MSGVSKLLDEELQKRARQELKSLGSKGEVAIKLKAIIAVKDHGVSHVAKIFNITRATLTNWVKAFKKSNSLALVAKKKNPKKSKVNNEQMQIIESWMVDNSSMTIRQLRQRIYEEFAVDLSISTAHRIMQRLEFSFITPRPRHYKQNPQLQVEFKKKSIKDSKR